MKRLLFFLFLGLFFLTSCITVKVKLFDETITTPKRTKISKNTVLHFKLSGQISMYPDGGFSLFGGSSESAHELILKINSAKTDKRVTAILLQPHGVSAGQATLLELQAALLDFKTSGKKIYAYINTATNQDIFLLSVADEVYMNPSASAGFVLSGVGGDTVFLKELLDKLGVEAHIVRAGEYKGAGEPFTRTEMSDELRTNLSGIYTDVYEQMLVDISNGYDLNLNDVRNLYEEREKFIINLDYAISTGIIDDLQFFDTMLTKLNIEERQLVLHNRYTPTKIKRQKQHIAVVYMDGNIVSNGGSSTISSSEYVKLFDEIMNNDRIKAVVLRINSGGGSALASEIIHAKLNQLKEKKPIIVSLGSMAASGGYYLATNADYIYANPYTITGSIGVFAMMMNLHGTADMLGVSFESLGHGKFVNAGNPFQPFNEEFEQAMQLGVNDVYNEFKTRVSEGRNMSLDDVEAVAKGQVWSATKALEYNLVDELGLLNDAINKAIEVSEIGQHTMLYYPERRSFFTSFMSGFNANMGQIIRNAALPSAVNDYADYYFNFIEEVNESPIQMRSEFILFF